MANNIISEQAFLALLTEIQRNSHTMVMTKYHDPAELINVNLDTREIELKTSIYKDFIGIARDHYAETLYFKVPRYYNDVDLMKMVCVVEYVNAKGDSYIVPILTRDICSYPGYIVFGWNIHGYATIAAGTLSFAFRFYSIDNLTHEIAYSLCTKPVSAKVSSSLVAQNATREPGLINAYSLDELLSIVNNKLVANLWWTNL